MNDTALVKLDAARMALAECKTAMEAKSIADVAEAARVYLERTNASSETVNRAAEIRTLAERQMGEFLKQMPKAKGTAGSGRPRLGGASEEPPNYSSESVIACERCGRSYDASKWDSARNPLSGCPYCFQKPPTLSEIGITKKQSSSAQKLADIPQEEFQARIETAKEKGEKITTARILRGDFSEVAKRAGDDAKKDSETLWRLKSLWKKTNKRDRAAFIAWATNNE